MKVLGKPLQLIEEKTAMQIYQVGGAVRDKLLDLPVKDRDWVVVGATPAALLERGFTQVGKDFPVFLHPETHEEYALARTERKTGSGYTGFAVFASPSVTLEEDLSRRDLTINAMASDEAGHIIDPFNGQADLQTKILRHVSPAFVEDPVRILRIARFAARLNFQVAGETRTLMETMVANGEVDALVPERVWQEMVRALADPYPRRFIEVLRECGALARIFPAVDRLFGVPQRADFHPEVDTGEHILQTLQQARLLTDDASVMFACLVHDLGKGTTPDIVLPRHTGHEARSLPLVKALCNRYKVPNAARELALLVAEYHTHCHQALNLKATTLLKTLQALDAFRRPQRFAQFLLACEADARGRGPDNACKPYPQAAHFQSVFAAARDVNAQAVVAEGFKGAAVKEELYQRRVTAIKQQLCQD